MLSTQRFSVLGSCLKWIDVIYIEFAKYFTAGGKWAKKDTAWKGSKYGVFSGPYLDIFHAVRPSPKEFSTSSSVLKINLSKPNN